MFRNFILQLVAMTDILRITGFFIVNAGIKQQTAWYMIVVWHSAVEEVPHSYTELLRFVIVRSKTRCWLPLRKCSFQNTQSSFSLQMSNENYSYRLLQSLTNQVFPFVVRLISIRGNLFMNPRFPFCVQRNKMVSAPTYIGTGL
jgi:hypothetical protein